MQARCLVQMAVAFNMGVSECNRRTVSPQNRAVCSSQHPLGLSRPYSYWCFFHWSLKFLNPSGIWNIIVQGFYDYKSKGKLSHGLSLSLSHVCVGGGGHVCPLPSRFLDALYLPFTFHNEDLKYISSYVLGLLSSCCYGGNGVDIVHTQYFE